MDYWLSLFQFCDAYKAMSRWSGDSGLGLPCRMHSDRHCDCHCHYKKYLTLNNLTEGFFSRLGAKLPTKKSSTT
jgi:hypothetical protein